MTPNEFRKINSLTSELARYQTSHLLHFIMTMVSGFWLIIWILVADENAVQRARIRNKIGKLQDPNYKPEHTGRLLTITVVTILLVMFIITIIGA